jgi:hypothetical protein
MHGFSLSGDGHVFGRHPDTGVATLALFLIVFLRSIRRPCMLPCGGRNVVQFLCLPAVQQLRVKASRQDSNIEPSSHSSSPFRSSPAVRVL